MNRMMLAMVLGISQLMVWGVVSPAYAQRSGIGPKLDNAARSATARELSRMITVDLTDSRLEDVIQFVRDYSGAEIEAYWLDDSTTGAGLDKDQRITISVKNIPVITFLERVLEKANTDLSPATWQFSRDGGALEVGPRGVLNKQAFLVAYDIQDMIFTIPNFPDAPELDLDQALQQGGGGGGGGNVFEEEGEDDPQGRSQEELAQEIMDIITQNIEMEQWVDNGGDGATIRFYNGSILVRAPDYIHRQLAGYPFEFKLPLEAPRAAAKPEAPAPTP